jgi:hypothetical protein
VWYEGSKRPYIAGNHAAEVVNNKLYLFGGMAPTVGGMSRGLNSVQIGTLTTVSGKINITWKLGASMPQGSGAAASSVIGGKV